MFYLEHPVCVLCNCFTLLWPFLPRKELTSIIRTCFTSTHSKPSIFCDVVSSGLIEKIYISRNQFRINCEYILSRFHLWWHKRLYKRFRKRSANSLTKLMIATWCCCGTREHSFSCYARSLQWKWLLLYTFCVVCVRDVLFCCWKWLLLIFPAALSVLELPALVELVFFSPLIMPRNLFDLLPDSICIQNTSFFFISLN